MVSAFSGCVIVSGLVAHRLPKAARVLGDDMNQMIKSGYVGWMGKPPQFLEVLEELHHDSRGAVRPRHRRDRKLAPGRGARARLSRLGFSPGESETLSALHTRNFM